LLIIRVHHFDEEEMAEQRYSSEKKTREDEKLEDSSRDEKGPSF